MQTRPNGQNRKTKLIDKMNLLTSLKYDVQSIYVCTYMQNLSKMYQYLNSTAVKVSIQFRVIAN